MDIGIFYEALGEKAFTALSDITAYIDTFYNMDMLYNGKDELKFQRSKKTLITFYIKEKTLTALIIFGSKERELFDERRLEFSEYIRDYYDRSKTYHDGKWMFIELLDDAYVGDIIKMIMMKKKPNKNVLTMCGYKCDLCKAYAKNIKKEDMRQQLSEMWIKYFNLDVNPVKIYCDGCRSRKKDAKFVDDKCPVRVCVLQKNLHGCYECDLYPCDTFYLRKGLSLCEACEKLGDDFRQDEYDTYIKAYDNKTRNDEYLKIKDKYDITLS